MTRDDPNPRRYQAYWQHDGQITRVFPRSRTTSCFDSVSAALSALETRARRHPTNSRGLVYVAPANRETDQPISTVAL